MIIRINDMLKARREGLKKDEGFSLIELLVVVIIIGILAAIAIPIYIGVQNSAKDSAVQSDLTNAKTAVVAYNSATGNMPVFGTTGATDLSTYGYTKSSSSTIAYSGSATTIDKFCLTAAAVSDATKKFYAPANGGVSGALAAAPTGC